MKKSNGYTKAELTAMGYKDNKAALLALRSHKCMEHAVPYYERDGALGHGWECGICGCFLQAG